MREWNETRAYIHLCMLWHRVLGVGQLPGYDLECNGSHKNKAEFESKLPNEVLKIQTSFQERTPKLCHSCETYDTVKYRFLSSAARKVSSNLPLQEIRIHPRVVATM